MEEITYGKEHFKDFPGHHLQDAAGRADGKRDL